jgi:UDP-glucuronate decarboxylase
MESPDEITGPVNLGNPGEFTMLELAQKVLEITESKAEIIFHPLPQDDPKQRKPNIEMAEQLLQWKPSISLGEGLESTVNYFKTTLNM